jgi:hypothetical protein
VKFKDNWVGRKWVEQSSLIQTLTGELSYEGEIGVSNVSIYKKMDTPCNIVKLYYQGYLQTKWDPLNCAWQEKNIERRSNRYDY